MTDTFFTADIHFGHRAMLDPERGNRPFRTTDEMDEFIVKAWNEVVGPRDNVYVLGDVSFAPYPRTLELVNSLNGRLHLVAGNHDEAMLKKPPFVASFEWVKDLHYLRVDGCRFALCHYPLATWRNCHKGSFHLHGHSHGGLSGRNPARVDVGVDCWRYRPVILERVLDVLGPYTPCDHHR